MKTTIDIADALLAEARALAARKKTTLRALVDEGLRKALNDHDTQTPFQLKDGSFGGGGLSPEWRDAPWDEIRDAAYGLPRK